MGRAGSKAVRLAEAALCSRDFQNKIENEGRSYGNAPGLSVEEHYVQSAPLAHRKRFAQFFTPPSIVEIMTNWVMATSPKNALDPACGTGIFVRAIFEQNPKVCITGVDVDKAVLNFARAALPKDAANIKLVNSDYLLLPQGPKYDAILLNPPYLKHHDFSYKDELVCRYSAQTGISFSRLSNLYVFFIVKACLSLKPGGRAAIIVPFEWANANYGTPLKEFLLREGGLKEVLYFNHSESVFPSALTTACILKIENSPSMGTVSVERLPGFAVAKHDVSVIDLLKARKWELIVNQGDDDVPEGFVPLRTLATTRRGIATGANEFFCISTESAVRMGIQSGHCVPCLTKASDVGFYVFSKKDLLALNRRGRRNVLLTFSSNLNAAERAYIEQGVKAGFDQRYLNAKRKPWYSMETLTRAPILVAVFGRQGLRSVLNSSNAYNLTAFHGIFPNKKDAGFAEALVACLNSRTVQRLARRVFRVYGGGLLKVEPRDLLDLPVPDIEGVSGGTQKKLSILLHELDKAKRDAINCEALEGELDRAVLAAGREASKLRSRNQKGLQLRFMEF